MVNHEVQVGVDYHQFYLWDSSVTTKAPDEYTETDVGNMVKLADSVVVVRPVRSGTVPVRIDLDDSDPGFDAASHDHVVECSLDVPGGQLQLHECLGGPVLDIHLPPGSYQVRVLFSSLASVSNDGTQGSDRYTVQLWPGQRRDLTVVKRWAGGDNGG